MSLIFNTEFAIRQVLDMGKLILFNLVDGSIEEGVSVLVTIYEEDSRKMINQIQGKLAANSDLENKYLRWQIPYRKLVNDLRSGRMSLEGVCLENKTQNEIDNLKDEIRAANKQLNKVVNDWLQSEREFYEVGREIDRSLKDNEEEIRLVLDTRNIELQKIPFFLWNNFFEHYHRAGFGLGLPVKNTVENIRQDKVKVIAVFGSKENLGNGTQIRIDHDWEEIKRHLSTESNADLIRLQEPTLDDLGDSIEAYCPQILFFAGHSFSPEDSGEGRIQLNRNEEITIHDLKYDLKKAAKKGLKLAIFNSCDGMGIARQLEDVGISNIIVMREPVPDEVAHRFLRRFLERFAFGRSINLAVRRGREQLQRLERKYPGVSCLPVLWQNPAEPPLTWEQLGGVITQSNKNEGNSIIWQETQINNSEEKIKLPENSTVIQSQEGAENLPKNEIVEKKPENTPLSESFPEAEKHHNSNKNLSNPNTKEFLGIILRNRYKIVKLIGQGGFGKTYLAIDLDFPGEKRLVVKHLSVISSNSEHRMMAKRLFKLEATALSKLGEHNGIPRLYSYFEEKGNFFLVQELIDGKDLSLEFQSKNRWGETETISFLHELLEILAYVHQENIIHRDIKPSNIIRRNNNNKLVLIDFGAVKETITSIDEQKQNKMTVAIGTQAYSSPEQLMGKPGKYSDVYAVGILAIQALTGLSPIDIPRNSEQLEQIWKDLEIKITPKLKLFLSRMVSSQLKNRFSDATQALDALAKIEKKQNNILEKQNNIFYIFNVLSDYVKQRIILYLLNIMLLASLFGTATYFTLNSFINNLPVNDGLIKNQPIE